MDYSRIFKMQKELDAHIEREKQLPHGQNRIEYKKDALRVELAECENEVRYFKFWSHKGMDREKTLEEYVDGLHFFASLGLDFGVPVQIQHAEIVEKGNLARQFRTIHRYVLDMRGSMHWHIAFSLFRGLGDMLGFTEQEVEDAYMAKNQTNHDRQEAGY